MSYLSEFEKAKTAAINLSGNSYLPDNFVGKTATSEQKQAFVTSAKQLDATIKATPQALLDSSNAAVQRINTVREKVSAKANPLINTAKDLAGKVEAATKELNELKTAATPNAEVIAKQTEALKTLTETSEKATKKANAWQRLSDRVDATESRFKKGENSLKTKANELTIKTVSTDKDGQPFKNAKGETVTKKEIEVKKKFNKTELDASRVKESPALAKAYADTDKAFDAIANKESIDQAKKIGGSTTSPVAAEAAKSGGWLSRIKTENIGKNFGKEASFSSKAFRGGTVAAGAALVYDAVSRSKSGDQDRSGLVRVGEALVGGAGIVGGLAYR